MAQNPGIDWEALIRRGVESEELDYKAAQNWRDLSRSGKAKFARHCMALANTKGGYLVVGVSEDGFGRPGELTGLTEEQAKSFDPTDVGAFINRCADPPVDFDIEKPVVDGKQYVVFVIRRFSELPHVCVYSLNHELSQGSFYIRTKDAASRVAYRATEVHALIQRALRNQRESLGRMLRGILYENRQTVEDAGQQPFRDQLFHSRRFLGSHWNGTAGQPHVRLDIAATPEDYIEDRFSLTDVRRAVEESSYSFREWPFAAIGNGSETYFTNTSLRSLVFTPLVHWQAFQTGLFHHQRLIPINKKRLLSHAELVRAVAEAVFFLGQYYTALGLEEQMIAVDFQLEGAEDVGLLLQGGHGRGVYTCRIPTIQYQLVRSAANLASGPAEHAARAIRHLCERFNMPAGRNATLHDVVSAFLQRQGGAGGSTV